MPRTTYQRKAFEFLKQKFETQEPFTKNELCAASGFQPSSFAAYFKKQFEGLLKSAGQNQFRVSGVFRQFRTWKAFQQNVVSQKRQLARAYSETFHEQVVIFEFYMPLRNELWLRETLDSLFFWDSIHLRLQEIGASEMSQIDQALTVTSNEETEAARIRKFVSDRFGGYSITLVNGRFRASELKTRAEATGPTSDPYLIDETTAVVKFIVPCRAPTPADADHEATAIRIFFNHLFVRSVLEVVNAEDEVWVMESGMRTRLQIYRACT